MFLDNIAMGKKLIGGFLVIVVILVVVAGIGYINISDMTTRSASMYNDVAVPIDQLGKVAADMQQLRAEIYRYDFVPASRTAGTGTIASVKSDIKTQMDAYRATTLVDEEKVNLAKFDTSYTLFLAEMEKNFQAADANDSKAVDASLAAGSPLITARTDTVAAYRALLEINVNEAKKLSQQSDDAGASAKTMMLIATIIGSVIAIILGFVLSRSITDPIARVIGMMNDISRGVLGTRLKMNRKDEIGQLADSQDQFAEKFQSNIVVPILKTSDDFAKGNFTSRMDENLQLDGEYNKFRVALNNVGSQVSEAIKVVQNQVTELQANAEEANASTEEVSAGAQQLAKSSGIVSSNADRSGSGMDQIQGAMNDLAKAVQQVAIKTESVSKLATEANTYSKEGVELAGKAAHGMASITTSANDVEKIIDEIKQQMDEIGKIVGVISDIADQTNMLALNAAIEAARAGDAGLGFAVVANEVKSLAQESQSSAENIATIIGKLQKSSDKAATAMGQASSEVKAGGVAVSQSLESFNKIVKAVQDINVHLVQVAAATEEQAAATEEITASVSEVGSLVQDTAKEAVDSAAATEEASAAIDQVTHVINNVNVIIERLNKEMNKFKV